MLRKQEKKVLEMIPIFRANCSSDLYTTKTSQKLGLRVINFVTFAHALAFIPLSIIFELKVENNMILHFTPIFRSAKGSVSFL